jgi:hypothetical protein
MDDERGVVGRATLPRVPACGEPHGRPGQRQILEEAQLGLVLDFGRHPPTVRGGQGAT